MRRYMLMSMVIGVVSMTWSVRAARAYCVTPLDMASFWSDEFDDLRIPVWINVSAQNSVANTGQTPQDVAKLMIEVIARHNETAPAPKLYFAGFTKESYDRSLTAPLVPETNFPAGITIMSMTCDEVTQKPICGGGPSLRGCASFNARPQVGDPASWSDPLGWVLVVPADCPSIDMGEWSMTEYPDLAQLVLHEIGHTLGLHHANLDKLECESSGNVHGGLLTGANGVMQTAMPANFAAFRSWRRDDLAGMDHLFGVLGDPLEIAWWQDDEYPAYPDDSAARSLIGMDVSRSVAVSNRTHSGLQALVSTAPDGRVIHRLMDDEGQATPATSELAVDAGPSGRTWAMPAVALGTTVDDDRVFVAWMADETPNANEVTLRTATRSLTELDWAYANHPDEFRVGRVAAGFVPGAEAFMITTLTPATTEIRVALFDAGGGALGSAITFEGLQAFDVGAPLCQGSRCLIPFSEPAFGGPNFAVVEVDVDPSANAVSVVDVEVRDAVDTFGRLALLDDQAGLLAGMGERRFRLDAFPELEPDLAAFVQNPNDAWPLGIGAWKEAEGQTTRLFQPRAVLCGNGIRQAGEACDDGNTIAGDGCDACVVEPDEPDELDEGGDADTNDAGGSDEVGESSGPAGADEAGCECRAGASRSRAPGSLVLVVVVVALARRRRARQRGSTPR